MDADIASQYLQLALDFTDPGLSPDSRQQLYDFMPEGTKDLFEGIFSRMEQAEEVIDEMKSRYPGREQEVHNTFKFLCPPALFQDAGPSLYKAFCRETIMLFMDGKAKKQFAMTSAEICLVLKELSLKAPLTHDATALYFKHFIQCFSQAEIDKVFPEGLPDMRPSYQGALDELEYMLRRRYEGIARKVITND